MRINGKRINTVIDCVMQVQVTTAMAMGLMFLAHKMEVGEIYLYGEALTFAPLWVGMILFCACFLMFIPYFAWKSHLGNSCCNDREQRLVDDHDDEIQAELKALSDLKRIYTDDPPMPSVPEPNSLLISGEGMVSAGKPYRP